jgi:hypothetical protein
VVFQGLRESSGALIAHWAGQRKLAPWFRRLSARKAAS